MFMASSRKSISSSTSWANSSTNPGRLAMRARRLSRSATRAMTDRARMSASKRWRSPGRCTFTATSVPSASRARCTWAMLAAATGVGSIDSNVSARRWPSSRSITSSATPALRHGTSSRHQAKASVQGSGSAPLAVAMSWPSFT